MISDKGIRRLCYAFMVVIYIISVFFLLLGISNLLDENETTNGWILIVFGIVLPLITTISLYPIFTLANINQNLVLLNEKVDTVIKNQDQKPKEASFAEQAETLFDEQTETDFEECYYESEQIDDGMNVNDDLMSKEEVNMTPLQRKISSLKFKLARFLDR